MTAYDDAAGNGNRSQSAIQEFNDDNSSGNNNESNAPRPSSSSGPSNQLDENDSLIYYLKWVKWNSGKIPIVMQSKNGPCPLIAIMNVLLLREKVKLPDMLEQITDNQLLTYLGECIMDCVPDNLQNDESAMLNFEQNVHDAIEVLPKLRTGLDVNIRFTGITDFEYTPECIIFDLLRIPLYHGWLKDPNLTELTNAIGNMSYNQLVDYIITHKSFKEPDISARVLIAEEFLERTASQLTQHGLRELHGKILDNEIGILFRNNHFLTLFKQNGEIYTLVTDHGYLTEENIVWETLDNIEGAGQFLNSNFQTGEATNRQVSEFQFIDKRLKQVENDFLIALMLNKEEEAAAAQRSEPARQLYEQLALPVSDNDLQKLLNDLDGPRKSSGPDTNDRDIDPSTSEVHSSCTGVDSKGLGEEKTIFPEATALNRSWADVASSGQAKLISLAPSTPENPTNICNTLDSKRITSDPGDHLEPSGATADLIKFPDYKVDTIEKPESLETEISDTVPPRHAKPSQSSTDFQNQDLRAVHPQRSPTSQSLKCRHKHEKNSKDTNCIVS